MGSDKTGGNAAYIGFGTMGFVYTINGGYDYTKGGPNYTTYNVTTVFGGTLNLDLLLVSFHPTCDDDQQFFGFQKR